MRLTIVIPAYNEEEAIAATIQRCLTARRHIVAATPVTCVEVIVVSDGSSDHTVEIAAEFVHRTEDLRLIEFERNRGYGAAIKKGFQESTGELVGFLDADGTCDPMFFAELCNAIVDEQADVAIGSRMGPQSRMPRVRRIGNRLYALMLSTLSNRVITDTASGMRVIRRAALPRLYPLPDGLHFTPAISARVLMDETLTLVERPMAYEERIGESKLHVLCDGWRFLRIILKMALLWRPDRCFATAAFLCFALMVAFSLYPFEMWIRQGRLREDMIYRLLFCSLMGTLGTTLLSAALIAARLQRIFVDSPRPQSFVEFVLEQIFTFRVLFVTAVPSAGILAWLIGPGVLSWLSEGYVPQHWSRVVLAGLIVFGLGQMFVTATIARIIRFHAARRPFPVDGVVLVRKESKSIEPVEPSVTDDIPNQGSLGPLTSRLSNQ